MANDVTLGREIQAKLQKAGIETPLIHPQHRHVESGPHLHIESSFRRIMEVLGLDLADDSLHGTPGRVAKMFTQEVFLGLDYANFPKCTTVQNKMHYDEMILSKGVDVLSVCEHHFVPFIGKAHIAYIPKTKVLGLSKFNRVVDFFARRPQVQERLTEQVHAAFTHILDTQNVAVVIKAQHMCVKLRGVKQNSTETITSKISGLFKQKPAVRAEFFSLIKDA